MQPYVENICIYLQKVLGLIIFQSVLDSIHGSWVFQVLVVQNGISKFLDTLSHGFNVLWIQFLTWHKANSLFPCGITGVLNNSFVWISRVIRFLVTLEMEISKVSVYCCIEAFFFDCLAWLDKFEVIVEI